MNNNIIVRVRTDGGQYRIEISPVVKLSELKRKIQEVTHIPIQNQKIYVDENNRPVALNSPDQLSIQSTKKIENGTILTVKGDVVKEEEIKPKTEIKQSQPLRIDNKPITQNQLESIRNAEKEKEKAKNEETDKHEEDKQTRLKWLCAHGPNGKCPNCVDAHLVSNAKHISFDEWLKINKFPPSQVSFKINKGCPYHNPWPKGMCSKCMPPSVLVKRQEYRHVDYAQFMNQQEIGNFVQYWVENSFAIQRLGYLYGYYAEDPNYAEGIRAVVEAVYEPPQNDDISRSELVQDEYQVKVDMIAEQLGLERVGWIYTTLDHDTFMSSHDIRTAAQLQEKHVTVHPCGYKVSKFITVVVRTNDKGEVVPDVYMVSDLAQALERDGIFDEPERRKMCKIREPLDETDVVPSVICQNRATKEIEPDFFLVNIAHGAPKSNKFATLKNAEFPIENRTLIQNVEDLKKYLQKNSKKPSHIKYGDFHLLLFLSKILDIDTACVIADCVKNEAEISPDIEVLIKSIAGLN